MNRKLKKILEENNLKSPDILTAVINVNTQYEAWRIALLFEEVTGDDLPFNLEKWEKSVRPPVELYFIFKRFHNRKQFVKKVKREFPEMEILI